LSKKVLLLAPDGILGKNRNSHKDPLKGVKVKLQKTIRLVLRLDRLLEESGWIFGFLEKNGYHSVLISKSNELSKVHVFLVVLLPIVFVLSGVEPVHVPQGAIVVFEDFCDSSLLHELQDLVVLFL